MKNLLPLFCLVFLSASCVNGQDNYTIAFYNVENLMDTIDNPRAQDNDFLPNGKYKWNTKRYHAKLKSIATVISQLGDKDGPEIIGLAEVENVVVLKDLTQNEQLKKLNYAIVHFDSPDERGIDVALLYKKNNFTLLSAQALSAAFVTIKSHTRDVLLVKGLIAKDTVFLFVNHWPSRRKGAEATEDKRIGIALMVREKIDSILYKNKNANIIVMGDFNDTPQDKSLRIALNSGGVEARNKQDMLYNPFLNITSGTIFYQHKWFVYDQLLISKNLMKSLSNYQFINAAVFEPKWLLYKQSLTYGPYRTYMGSDYKGGYSDHLPVYIQYRK